MSDDIEKINRIFRPQNEKEAVKPEEPPVKARRDYILPREMTGKWITPSGEELLDPHENIENQVPVKLGNYQSVSFGNSRKQAVLPDLEYKYSVKVENEAIEPTLEDDFGPLGLAKAQINNTYIIKLT